MKFTVTVFYADKQVDVKSGLKSDAVLRLIFSSYKIKTSSIEEIEAIKEQKTFKFKNGAGVDSKIVVKKEAKNEG